MRKGQRSLDALIADDLSDVMFLTNRRRSFEAADASAGSSDDDRFPSGVRENEEPPQRVPPRGEAAPTSPVRASGRPRRSTGHAKQGVPLTLADSASTLFGPSSPLARDKAAGPLVLGSSASETQQSAALSELSRASDEGLCSVPTMLGRHKARQEAAVENWLYDAVNIPAAARPTAAFCDFLQKIKSDAPTLAYLRRSSTAPALLTAIASAVPTTVESRLAQIAILDVFSHAVPCSALIRRDVLTRLREAAERTSLSDTARHPPASNAPRGASGSGVSGARATHWSKTTTAGVKKHAEEVQVQPADESSSLEWREQLLSMLADSAALELAKDDVGAMAAVLASIVARRLVADAFAADREVAVKGLGSTDTGTSDLAVEAVVACGLWHAALRLIASAATATEDEPVRAEIAENFASIAEMTSCVAPSGRISALVAPETGALYELSLASIHQAVTPPAAVSLAHFAFRIFLNLTTILPAGIGAMSDASCARLVASCSACFASGDENLDSVTLAACALLNVLTIRPDPLADALAGSAGVASAAGVRLHETLRMSILADERLVATAADLAVRYHEGDDANIGAQVCGGYIALLLATVTLGSEASRVGVIQHVARALKAASRTDSTLVERPMKYVAAVVQEFVLFQSGAGILTRRALLLMHSVSAQLISENS